MTEVISPPIDDIETKPLTADVDGISSDVHFQKNGRLCQGHPIPDRNKNITDVKTVNIIGVSLDCTNNAIVLAKNIVERRNGTINTIRVNRSAICGS